MKTHTVILFVLVASPLARSQTIQIAPPVPQREGFFGSTVAGVRVGPNAEIRDNAIVASPEEDLPGGFVDAGRVRVFDGRNGVLLHTINPPNKQPFGLFGFAVAGIDRVNADNFGEILVGAPMERPGANAESVVAWGRAYLFDGRTGAMLRALRSPSQQTFSMYGWAVAAIPDVNSDGCAEYAVSAPGEWVPTPNSGFGPNAPRRSNGRVFLYSGTGILLRTFVSPNVTADEPLPTPLDPLNHLNFGMSIAGVPDVNGDGRGDILISAPKESPGAAPSLAGRVYLFSGATGAWLRTFAAPQQTAGGAFGTAIAGAADLNGDGRGDVVISSPARGVAYVFSGATGSVLRTLARPEMSTGSSGFGQRLTVIPDASGDGRPDIAIPLPNDMQPFAAAGTVRVYNGVTGAVIQTLISPRAEAGGGFGNAIAALRNPTGTDALLIGAAAEDPGTAPGNSGRAYIMKTYPYLGAP